MFISSFTLALGSILSLETGATYQWLDCDNGMNAIPGATNALFQPPNPGNYSVALGKNGCLDTSDCYNVVLVGINSLTPKPELKYYPNPVQDHLTLEFDRNYHQISIEVYNIAGQIIRKTEFNDSKTINYPLHIPPGIYMMSVQMDNKERQWLKLVK